VVRELRRSFVRLMRTFHPDPESGIMVEGDSTDMIPIFTVRSVLEPGRSCFEVADGFDDIPQIMLLYIISVLTRLETLLLQLPIRGDHEDYRYLLWRLLFSSELPSVSNRGMPFQHLTTLLLQGDPDLVRHFQSDNCSCETPEVYGCKPRLYWPMMEAFPKLTTLEISHDDGEWQNYRPDFRDGVQQPYFPRIQHLYLHESDASPRSLHQVLSSSPELQTLYMTPRADYEYFHEEEDEDSTFAHEEALDIALLQRARHLRHLDIGWFDCRNFESLIGPEGRLASLPEMTSLEKLYIQLSVIYGSNPAMLRTPLVELLPPALAELTLEEWWWANSDILEKMGDWQLSDRVLYYQSKQEYRANAIGILTQFALEAPKRIPTLRKVSFLTRITPTWVLEDSVPMQYHFENVTAVFAKSGVTFLAGEV
jgi:hypothetical protein